MNIFYYFLGSFLFLIFNVLYGVFTDGRFELNQNSLLVLAIRGLLAGGAFFLADYMLSKKS